MENINEQTGKTHMDTKFVKNEAKILWLSSEIFQSITMVSLDHHEGSTLPSSNYKILIDCNSKIFRSKIKFITKSNIIQSWFGYYQTRT